MVPVSRGGQRGFASRVNPVRAGDQCGNLLPDNATLGTDGPDWDSLLPCLGTEHPHESELGDLLDWVILWLHSLHRPGSMHARRGPRACTQIIPHSPLPLHRQPSISTPTLTHLGLSHSQTTIACSTPTQLRLTWPFSPHNARHRRRPTSTRPLIHPSLPVRRHHHPRWQRSPQHPWPSPSSPLPAVGALPHRTRPYRSIAK